MTTFDRTLRHEIHVRWIGHFELLWLLVVIAIVVTSLVVAL